MFGHRRFAVTREGWFYFLVALMVLGGAVMREGNLLMLLAGLLSGLACAVLVLMWLNIARLSVRRVLPEGICAGDRLVVEMHLQSLPQTARPLGPDDHRHRDA